MSRPHLRSGVREAPTGPRPDCEGPGLMRTAASAGLSALRMIEDEATRGRGDKILLRAGREAAVYVLNKKRIELADIEQRYGVSIEIAIDESFEGARMTVESSGPRPVAAPRPEMPLVEEGEEPETVEISLEDEEEEEEEEAEETTERGEAPAVERGVGQSPRAGSQTAVLSTPRRGRRGTSRPPGQGPPASGAQKPQPRGSRGRPSQSQSPPRTTTRPRPKNRVSGAADGG